VCYYDQILGGKFYYVEYWGPLAVPRKIGVPGPKSLKILN